MSADNGIYIGNFVNKEWRVIHAAAIENLQHKPDTDDGYNSKCLVRYFGEQKKYQTESEAFQRARKLEKQIRNDPICPVLEYGISILKFKHPFTYYLYIVTNEWNFCP